MFPRLEDRRPFNVTFDLSEPAMQQFGPLGKRHASPWIRGRLRRRRPVQRAQEPRARSSDRCHVEMRRGERRLARKPRDHGPSPWKAAAWTSSADRRRNPERQLTRELREPALLVLDQLRGGGAAGQTHGELVAKSKEAVVPALDALAQGQFAQVWVLLAQQLPDDGRIDVDVGAWPAESYLRTVPVTPSGEQLNGSIFKSDGAYSIVARENGCVKNSGSVISTSTTSR